MAHRQGGWLLAKTLLDLGVSDIFTLAGGHINPIYNACTELGIRLIDTHHEQGASMAADAYGRVNRKPGVCLVTAGPGLTNALTGVAGAYLSNSPMLLIAGRSGIEENDKLSLQEIDQNSMVKPVTKWERTIYDIKRIPEYVSNAYKIAISGRPGPVYLGTSYEVLYPSCNEKDIPETNIKQIAEFSEPKDSTITDFIKTISKSKKPIIVAGSGSWYSKSEKNLIKFVEKLKVPVFTLNMGRGIIPDTHRYCFGPASPSSPQGFREISGKSDLIILLGIRLSIYTGFGRTLNTKAKIIQVDIEPSEIGRNRNVDMAIVSDINSLISKANRYIDENKLSFNYSDWLQSCDSLRKKSYKQFEKILKSRKKTIHPVKVAKEVSDFLGDEGLVVVDGGDSQSWTDVSCKINKPGHYIKGGPLGCMGVGIPFALGTKLAQPDKNIALITGDGAVAMNFMELETAVRHKIPFVVVVCNDSAWGMTKHQIEITYPKVQKTQGVELGFINFHKIVKEMGGYGSMVENIKDLKPALKRAFNSGLPAVINVKTDPKAVSGATHVITEMMMSGM